MQRLSTTVRDRLAASVNSVFEPLEGRTLYATYTVTNINDDGPGSLRQAITTANASDAVDVIKFNIAGSGVHTISPQSALPNLSWDLTIDGTSQPGYAGKPLIEIEGSDAGAYTDGLVAFRSGIHLKGLCINRFGGYGIMAVTGGNTYKANFIGTDPTGMLDYGNNKGGMNLFAANNTVGGTTAADRNVIAGNDNLKGGGGYGITIRGDNNLVQGNYIGVAADGVTPPGQRRRRRHDRRLREQQRRRHHRRRRTSSPTTAARASTSPTAPRGARSSATPSTATSAPASTSTPTTSSSPTASRPTTARPTKTTAATTSRTSPS